MNERDSLVRPNVECDNGDTFKPVTVMRRSSDNLEYWTILFDSHLPHC